MLALPTLPISTNYFAIVAGFCCVSGRFVAAPLNFFRTGQFHDFLTLSRYQFRHFLHPWWTVLELARRFVDTHFSLSPDTVGSFHACLALSDAAFNVSPAMVDGFGAFLEISRYKFQHFSNHGLFTAFLAISDCIFYLFSIHGGRVFLRSCRFGDAGFPPSPTMVDSFRQF